MDVAGASPGVWVLLVVVALLIGLGKSFLPGAGILGIGLLAAVIPAKQASGVTLALVIVADWAAIWAYRRDVDFRALLRLLPNVAVGVVVGAAFLLVADDDVTRRTIGVIIVLFVGVNVVGRVRAWRRARSRELLTATPDAAPGAATSTRPADAGGRRRRLHPKSVLYGVTAGFTTMVANAGGPVTSLYFLSEGFTVVRFLGTTAWFYLIINLVKLPFSLGLGMLTASSLAVVGLLVPVVILAVLAGRWLARRIDRGAFTVIVLALSGAAGVLLLV